MKLLKRTAAHLALFAGLFWITFPIFWVFLTSIKPTNLAFSIPPVWKFVPTISGYQSVISEGILLPILHSTIIAFASTLLALILGIPTAYATTRFEFIGRNDLQYFILSLYFLPAVSLLIPLLALWKTLGLIGSYVPVIFMHTIVNLPLVVWVLKGFIDKVPEEIEEAAIIDGYNHFSILLKIIIPLILPGIIAVSIICFIFSWNEFLYSLVLTSRTTQTVTVALMKYITPAGIMWNKIAAVSILSAIVPVILIVIVRDRLAEGLSLGALK